LDLHQLINTLFFWSEQAAFITPGGWRYLPTAIPTLWFTFAFPWAFRLLNNCSLLFPSAILAGESSIQEVQDDRTW